MKKSGSIKKDQPIDLNKISPNSKWIANKDALDDGDNYDLFKECNQYSDVLERDSREVLIQELHHRDLKPSSVALFTAERVIVCLNFWNFVLSL